MRTDAMRPGRDCGGLQRKLTEDAGAVGAAARRHLRDCRSCREFAGRIEALSRELARTREIQPPPSLDRRLRSMLAEHRRVARALLRPAIAAGIGVAALLAFTLWVAASLAQAGAGESGPLIAVVLAWAYLALSAAATMPVLLLAGRRTPARAAEARS
ncbi:MAG TPA: hypothetical protein VD788_06350 [Candidatus Polarisedimenticolaceae bacterium]|nr:hypothetical protein [Candidatus Polarisedimenticolaceae bacterium]